MKPAAFEYHRARDVQDATRLLAELGEDAKVIAGGQSLVAMMNFRLARPQHLVDITGLADAAYLHADTGGALHIGALTTHHVVETAQETRLGPGYAVLRDAMRWVGHLPIRTRGTVGGSIAHGDATAEWCLLAVALDATFVVRGPERERRIEARDFFHGYYTTALEPDELLVEVVFPGPAPHAALTEFAQRRGDFAIVSAVVDLDLAADRRTVGTARVALGGVSAQPVRVPAAEAALTSGTEADTALFTACGEAAAAAIDPPDDDLGSAHYRRGLTRTLVAHACQEAMSR